MRVFLETKHGSNQKQLLQQLITKMAFVGKGHRIGSSLAPHILEVYLDFNVRWTSCISRFQTRMMTNSGANFSILYLVPLLQKSIRIDRQCIHALL